MAVELRHLRCFLAIVDEGNITRAALRLHMSQPALSRTLAQLERTVGVRLVDRSTHHLTLTDAGSTFAVTGREALERIAGLAAGQVDIALVRGPIIDPTMRSAVIDNERRLAVVPVDHRLAGMTRVSLADLSGETLIVNSVTGTTTLDLWPQPPRPTVGADTTTIDDWLVAIATSTGIGVTPASTATLHPHPDVRYIPIHDAPTVPLVLAWPRRQPHPHITAFVATARQVIPPGPPAGR